MEFNSRATPVQPQPARAPAPQQSEGPRPEYRQPPKGRKEDLLSMGTRIGSGTLLVVIALLLATLVWLIYTSSPASQNKYVNPSKLQAVFLNTGQVYFGNVTALNKDYLVLNNVYYLQSSSTDTAKTSTTDQNVSLVKLGCELHRPYDTMVINVSQVTFWENLQSDGQVGKAVTQFQQQNPNGQKCSDTNTNTSSNLQNTTSTKP